MMDSNMRFAVLVGLIVVAVGLSHWRLSSQIGDAEPKDAQAVQEVDGDAEQAAELPASERPDHYKRMAEAAVSANDPATRKSALRYLVMMSKSDAEMDPKLVDWARSELARQKAAKSPGLLGKQLELDVGGDKPNVGRIDDGDPAVGRIEEPDQPKEKDDYIRWESDEKSKGARPPDKGLVDPFSK